MLFPLLDRLGHRAPKVQFQVEPTLAALMPQRDRVGSLRQVGDEIVEARALVCKFPCHDPPFRPYEICARVFQSLRRALSSDSPWRADRHHAYTSASAL